ncbi:MAG: sn-glycerol-3-phosphate ABC transporter ATP-binding protein UgpC [Arcobacter sp.]|nr:sn-glycerol-3-phosphate ABC transporter ATP-binding protein UgpC [Arcobacter sp.]
MGSMVLKNIKKNYDGVEVLHDINIDIKEGEFVVLIGESGCGKSTLLRMICGLEDISSGELILNGKLANEISPQKRDMSMVFQSYALYPHMNVYENIAYGLKILKVPKEKINKKVQEAAKLLNIDKYLDRLPKNLSGGQRQRVSMGRAIVRKPNFFLFDEPLSNLDAKLRVVMRNEIKSLQKRLKTTTVYVTHDQIEAMTMADKVVLMDKGYAVQIGAPEELYDKPNSIFTATFLGSPNISLINGTIKIENNKVKFHSKDGINFPINHIDSLEEGQEVILGIRPRDFHSSENKEDFSVKINVHEYTGAENVIYGQIGENEVNLAFSRKEKFNKDEDLYVNYEVDKTHLFDAKTEKIIR